MQKLLIKIFLLVPMAAALAVSSGPGMGQGWMVRGDGLGRRDGSINGHGRHG